jgi:large subunit ribosomal protein L19
MRAQKLTKETILQAGVVDRNFPAFRVGDKVEVSLFVTEGKKERIQAFAGDVIAMHKNGIASTFTVRRISANNIGVEKIFPYHSPVISGVKLVKRGRVRRAKLYYVRDLIGKAARIRELVLTRAQKEQLNAQNEQSKAA